MSSARLAGLLSLVVTVCAFAGTADAPKASKKGRTVIEWSGTTGGGKEASAELVFTDAQWQALWKRLGRPAPQALGSNLAAVVFLGTRSTMGYSVKWLEPLETKDAVLLRWTEKKPAEDALIAQMITDPWSVRLFPKPAKGVRLEAERK